MRFEKGEAAWLPLLYSDPPINAAHETNPMLQLHQDLFLRCDLGE